MSHQTGSIHSIETMGLVDGPGIRCVVFMQGCALRCLYCHNPDTWSRTVGALQITAEELADRLYRYKGYFGDDGGVTFSGGEPLLQPEFLTEALRACRARGIRTCIDTAGVGCGDCGEILSLTDLVLFDVKHWSRERYRELTGAEIDGAERFLKACVERGIEMWISHVMVPGMTDDWESMRELAEHVAAIPNVSRIRVLPYHVLGRHKYAALGMEPPLEGVPPMDIERAAEFERYLNEAYRSRGR